MVKELFDVYLEELENNDQDSNIVKFKNKMVENYQKTPNPLIVSDYLSMMTDTYVLNDYERKFLPILHGEIIAIVNSDDSSSVQAALTEEGYFVTKLSTTGGFLKKGNTTFFIGTNDDKVEHAVGIIKENSKKRVEKEPTVPPTEMGEFFTPIMVDVLVGGATVFVLDIEQFEKF